MSYYVYGQFQVDWRTSYGNAGVGFLGHAFLDGIYYSAARPTGQQTPAGYANIADVPQVTGTVKTDSSAFQSATVSVEEGNLANVTLTGGTSEGHQNSGTLDFEINAFSVSLQSASS